MSGLKIEDHMEVCQVWKGLQECSGLKEQHVQRPGGDKAQSTGGELKAAARGPGTHAV